MLIEKYRKENQRQPDAPAYGAADRELTQGRMNGYRNYSTYHDCDTL